MTCIYCVIIVNKFLSEALSRYSIDSLVSDSDSFSLKLLNLI